jgi:phage protein D
VVADVFEPASISRSRRDVLSSEVAQAYANAEMRRRARRFVSVDGTTSGTPDLVPGTKLDLRRVGRPFEGDAYRCVYAHHSYDPSTGYRTRFRAERPGMAS